MERTRRLPELSALNVLLCLLVIFIHVSSAPVETFAKSGLRYAAVFFPWRFAGFVVPGFIFLSGLRLFLSKQSGIRYGKFYLDRLIKIVLPYIAWNVIYYLYYLQNGSYVLTGFAGYLLRGNLISPFYFIIVIIQFYALAPLWFLLFRKVRTAVAAAGLLLAAFALTLLCDFYLPTAVSRISGASFKYNDRILTTYLFYWVAGCLVGANYEKAKAWLIEKRRLVTIVFVLITAAEEALSYLHFSGRLRLGWLEIVHFLFCIGAVFFFFTMFSCRYIEKPAKSRLMQGIDKASYAIFLSHCLVMFLTNDLMHQAGVTGVSAAYLVRIVTVYTVMIALCLLWTQLKRRFQSGVLKRRTS